MCSGCPTRRTAGPHGFVDTHRGSQLLDSSFQNLVSKMNFIMEQLGEEDTRLTFRVLEQLAQILEGMSDEQEDTFNQL